MDNGAFSHGGEGKVAGGVRLITYLFLVPKLKCFELYLLSLPPPDQILVRCAQGHIHLVSLLSYVTRAMPSKYHCFDCSGLFWWKVKWLRYRPSVAQRMGRGIALLFHDRGTGRGWVVSSTPRRILPPGKIRYPFYRRLGELQGRSGRAENLVPIGIRSRTVQPVVSRYTDWATRPTDLFW